MEINSSQNRHGYIYWLIFLMLCYVPFFLHLGAFPMVLWDESRLAVNAFEMLHDKNYLVTHFDGIPDLWNTKPPLFIWIIALSYKLFGYNVLALRLPSAISGVVTASIFFYSGKKLFNTYKAGLIIALVLLTSTGYLGWHVVHNGDYDAFLTLICTAYLLAFYKFLYSDSKHDKYWFLFFISLVLIAFFTKTVQGLIFIPALIIYSLIVKKGKKLFGRGINWILVLIALSVVVCYYIISEKYNPGFIKATFQNDISGRYSGSIEDHAHPFNYYLKEFYLNDFSPWMYILPICIIYLFFQEDSLIKRFSWFLISCSGFYLFVISFSQTKTEWYDAPLFPLFALIVGLFICNMYFSLERKLVKPIQKNMFFAVFTLALFIQPYINDVANLTDLKVKSRKNFVYERIIKQASQANKAKNLNIFEPHYDATLFFYKDLYREKGIQINMLAPDNIKSNDTILSANQNWEELNRLFEVKTISETKDYKWGIVLDRRSIGN